jgi:hypothetical protein
MLVSHIARRREQYPMAALPRAMIVTEHRTTEIEHEHEHNTDSESCDCLPLSRVLILYDLISHFL